jgi:hypothetical protein
VPGKQPEVPGDIDEDRARCDRMAVVITSDASSVTAFYGGQWAESEAVLATIPLSARPPGNHG